MESILSDVSSLSDLEKLLLYLKLPTGRQRNSVSGNSNGTSAESGKIEQQVANRWIKTYLQEDKDICLPKQDVYDEYRQFCDKESHKWVNQADFGKLIKGLYPNIRTRRLGNRGQSKHCYGGLSMQVNLPVPEALSIQIPSPSSTQADTKVLSSMTDCGDLLPAACVLVCEWANKLVDQKVMDILELAQYLVSKNLVNMCSTAALTVSASLAKPPAAAGATNTNGEGSAPTTPIPGKQREAQIQLQRKLQEKEQLKRQKEKQKNISAANTKSQQSTSVENKAVLQPAPTSSGNMLLLAPGGQPTQQTAASNSAAIQRLVFLSPAPGSTTDPAAAATDHGTVNPDKADPQAMQVASPVASGAGEMAATNVTLFSPPPPPPSPYRDKPVQQQQHQHKPKNKYSSKTVSFLLKEQRGYGAQDKDDKMGYVNDKRPVSQLLKESRERKQKCTTSAMKVCTGNSPAPILIKPMSPKSQDNTAQSLQANDNSQVNNNTQKMLIENNFNQQASASELLQSFSQFKQQQLQQQQSDSEVARQFNNSQPLLQQEDHQQQQFMQQQLTQHQQAASQEQIFPQQQPPHMQQQMQQLQQLQQQPLFEQQQSLQQAVELNHQYDASYNTAVGGNGFDQFAGSPGSGGSLASATSTPMLSPACSLSPMMSNMEPNNSFTPIQQSALQQATFQHQQQQLQRPRATVGCMPLNNCNSAGNIMNGTMDNGSRVMFQQNLDFNLNATSPPTQYNNNDILQKQLKRSLPPAMDNSSLAGKRRRHRSAQSRLNMFASNPEPAPLMKEFLPAGAQEQSLNMMEPGFGSAEQWTAQSKSTFSPEVATILQPSVPMPAEQDAASAAMIRSQSVPVPNNQEMIDFADLFNDTGPTDFLPPPVPAPCKNMADQFIPPQDNGNTDPLNNLLIPQPDTSATTDKSSPYISHYRGDHMISGASVNDTAITRMKRLAACQYDK